MKRLVVAVLTLGLAGSAVAARTKTSTTKKPPPKFNRAQRMNAAMAYAQKKLGGDVTLGWNHGGSPLGIVAKTGSVRVSTGDDPGNTKADNKYGQFANYFISFGRNNKPNKLTFITTY
jgi:hypothetical protein